MNRFEKVGAQGNLTSTPSPLPPTSTLQSLDHTNESREMTLTDKNILVGNLLFSEFNFRAKLSAVLLRE